MNEKTQCSVMVLGEGSWGAFNQHKCHKPAVVEREGKWYCKIHDPEYIKAQSDKRWAEYEARSKARQRGWELEAARQAAVKGLSLEELQALKPERVKASNELYEALKYSAELIKIARQYFPKSIKTSDKFTLENTGAAIGKALAKADGG